MLASIRDIKDKDVWQLRKSRTMANNGMSIGVESGDDKTHNYLKRCLII